MNENSSSDDILGIPITAKEIHEQILNLKYKKASGMDSILNEMIKHGRYYLMLSLFDALVKPLLLYGCEIWGPELLSYKTHFDKSTFEQVHIKFCKQTLNTPWYTENKACRAELGRYPLSIDIKASIFSYWQRLHTKLITLS